jgi:tetratricopeptide (TPR) repeat protein
MSATENAEADVETPADGPFELDAVRANVEGFVDDGELDAARELLWEVADRPDRERDTDDNLWLYRTLGTLAEEAGETGAALEAYRRGFEVDPRDESILRPLHRLFQVGGTDIEPEFGIRVVQSLLVHHLSELDEADRADLYRRLGALYEEEGDYERARSNFEQAVEYTSDDARALTGLLRAVGAVGEPTDVIEVRRRLIESMDDPTARAESLVALGDDWRERFNDPARAIDSYEDALMEDGDSLRAHERIVKAARQTEDWSRVYRSCLELGRLVDDEETEADWLIEASDVARDEMWEPERALAGYRRAMELDPNRFDAFEAITQILLEARDWEALERAYLKAIEDHQKRDDAEREVLAVLWHKLGDLYHTHLEDIDGAATAYHRASEIVPNNLELHEKVAAICEDRPEHSEMAIEHLRALWHRKSQAYDVLDRIGRVYLRREEVDPALCHFRAIEFLGGELDDKPRGFVERFQSTMYKTPSRALDWQTMKQFVAPESLDENVTQIFRILYPVLADWTAERRSEYGLGRRDQINLDEPIAFNNIYRDIGGVLQYRDLPNLWRKSDQTGLIKAALKPEALIVGDDVFTSGQEKHMAFAIAKKLFLLYKPFYLVGLRPMSDLQAFFVLAVQLVTPDFEIESDSAMEAAYRKLENSITGEERERLAQAVEAATGGGKREVVLGRWIEAVEDAANRVGMLFADDLSVCESILRRDPQDFSERSLRERMKDLAEYTVSDRYLALRNDLGLRVET